MPAQTRSNVTGAKAIAPPAPPDANLEQRHSVVAMLAPVPVPGTPPGSHLPGVQAAGAVRWDGRIVAITRLAHAVPGKPDGEVDTRPLRPIWKEPALAWKGTRQDGNQ